MARPVAALTGATGFLGRKLAESLHAQGFHVRVLCRRPPAADHWGLEPEVVAGGLEDAAALARLARGVEVLVHAAGAIKARDRAGFFQVNAEGARRIAEVLAAEAPQARLVLVSSLSAREPGLSDYAASKAAGEAAVREAVAAKRLTIVRPPAIYGPGDRETLGVFQLARRSPVLPLPGGEGARLAMIHVADAAAQIAALAARPADGAVYGLSDARPGGYGWREVMGHAAAAVGRERPRFAPLPRSVVLGLGALVGGFGRAAGQIPILTAGKAREMLHPDWSLSESEIAPDLPEPRFDLPAGFADTVAWYRGRGWL
jgi:nucleoside-diphosphate-sugar epimerase